MYFVFKRKINSIFMKNFIKIGEFLVKNSETWWMKSTEFTLFSRKFKPRYLPVGNENQKKIFLIPRWTSFLVIPVSTLYDEYIDRSKLTEKKPSWVYSSSPLMLSMQNALNFMQN